jgi:hypothetical protein
MISVIFVVALVTAPPPSASVPGESGKRTGKTETQRPERCGSLIDTAAERLEAGVAILTRSKQKESPSTEERKMRFADWLETATGPIQNVKRMSFELHQKLSSVERKACLRYSSSRFRVALQRLATPAVRRDFTAELRLLGALFR